MTMNAIKKRQLFNLFGGAIIVLWIVMIGLLVRKVHFKSNEKHIEIKSKPAAFETGHRDWMEIYLKDSKI
ncbi:MAG: hypothetical protein KJ823_11330, partial [Proteobacteria bacterium]|nr:hypothetical protein [Pseudomonadota bacterium]